MWFRLGIQNFIGKKITHDDCCKLYISDFTKIWHTTMSNDELVSICQRLNPLFEASVQKLKELISNLFQDENAKKEITEENNSITLKLKSTSLGVKFLFQIVLHQQCEKIFYKEFTLPLLLVFIQMQNREQKLIKIITDKDTEIKEYKQEYGEIKCSKYADYMATEPFDKKEFESQELLADICNFNSFFECISSMLPSDKKEQPSCKNLSDKSMPSSSQKFTIDNKRTVFMDVKSKNGPSQCVKLEHQTVKRKKKQNDPFKIIL